jgi:hypothetical protein
MPRTFKQWTPAAPELELLHECWLARLSPAKIAARQAAIPSPACGHFAAMARAVWLGRALGRQSAAMCDSCQYQYLMTCH